LGFSPAGRWIAVRRFWLGLLALTAQACVVLHSAHNAPGHIEVAAPPSHLDSRTTESPLDPGEWMGVAALGPYAGGGLTLGGPNGAAAAGAVGAELTLQLGDQELSHPDDAIVFPRRSLGVSVGWAETLGDRNVASLYLEAQAMYHLVGLAAGWQIGPDKSTRGPQLTAFFGPLYLRGDVGLDGTTTVHLGVMLKFIGVLVWSK
jgi:hypothetical protein